MGTFTYTFTTPNTILNLTDIGYITINKATSANTVGTGAYTIKITETESGKSYYTNVTVNVKTLCKSINLNVNENNVITNYKTYNIAYNVQYNSGNNYTVTDEYRAATYTYTVTTNSISSGVKLENGKLVIPQLYEGNITITAKNNQNADSKKTITASVFRPNVTLNIPTTTYGTYADLTYTVESGADVGAVTFGWTGINTYYEIINGQTLKPLKAGDTSIKTYYGPTANFLAYASNDIPFTINKRSVGNLTLTNAAYTYGDSPFGMKLTYTNWFGTTKYILEAGNNINITEGGRVTITGAGTTVVRVNGTGDNNHNNFTKTATVTINKRDGNVTFNSIKKTYGDTAFNMSLTYTNWFGTTTYSVSAGNSYISITGAGRATITGAGTATVTATGTGDKNHNNFTKTATVTIDKRSAESYNLTGATYTYGASPFNMQLTYTKWYGTPKYSVTEGSSYITITEAGKVTVKGAGKSTVTVLGDGDNNHNDFTTTATVTIDKRTGNFTYGTKKLSYANKGTNYPIGLTYANWFGTIGYTITTDTLGNTISLSGDKINILNAGKATIKVSADGDKNHNDYTAYISCTVDKANRTFRFGEQSVTITYGNTHSMVAYKGDTNNTINSGITYESYKLDVATVDINGVVTPKAYGQAIIWGTWDGGRNYNTYYNPITVDVKRKTATLTLNDVTITYNPNPNYKTHQLILNKDTNGKITYSSSNESIATVNSNGVVTIQGAGGSSTITVQSSETGQYTAKSKTCTFTVNKASTELIVSTSPTSTSSDSNFNYDTSNGEYVLYVSVLDTSNNLPLSITNTDISLDTGNQYFDTTIASQYNDTKLKYTFTVNPDITNDIGTTLTFAFNNRYAQYYETPTSNAISVKINKQTAAIINNVSSSSIYQGETSTITVSNVNNRSLSVDENSSLVTASISGNKVSVKAVSNPATDTKVAVTINAAENAYYNSASTTSQITVMHYTETGGGVTDPDPDPSDTPGEDTGGGGDTQSSPYLKVGEQTAYSGGSITLNPLGSTTEFGVTAGGYTGSTNQNVTITGENVKTPSSFIAYNGCTLELKSATTSTITFSCSEQNFNIGQISLYINYSSTDIGGSVTPDGSITPGGDDYSWAYTYIDEVAYVIISNTATNPTAIGVASASGEELCTVMGEGSVPLLQGNDGSSIGGEISSLNSSSASISWTVTNSNGNSKTWTVSGYQVITGTFGETPEPTAPTT